MRPALLPCVPLKTQLNGRYPFVMPGLEPGIHVQPPARSPPHLAWTPHVDTRLLDARLMAGTRPAMTKLSIEPPP
jgi:hypothetical protein